MVNTHTKGDRITALEKGKSDNIYSRTAAPLMERLAVREQQRWAELLVYFFPSKFLLTSVPLV